VIKRDAISSPKKILKASSALALELLNTFMANVATPGHTQSGNKEKQAKKVRNVIKTQRM
jgi:hypothetical protein